MSTDVDFLIRNYLPASVPARNKENSWDKLKRLQAEVTRQEEPYPPGYDTLAMIHKEIRDWLRDPQHDCLRARGDRRWDAMCDLDSRCRSLWEPF